MAVETERKNRGSRGRNRTNQKRMLVGWVVRRWIDAVGQGFNVAGRLFLTPEWAAHLGGRGFGEKEGSRQRGEFGEKVVRGWGFN